MSTDASGKNEIVLFDAPLAGSNDIVIPWNNTRRTRFGDAAVFYVEVYNPDENRYLQQPVEAWPDDINATTIYTFRLSGPVSGRITIS